MDGHIFSGCFENYFLAVFWEFLIHIENRPFPENRKHHPALKSWWLHKQPVAVGKKQEQKDWGAKKPRNTHDN